jgi:hypothetical protein
MTHGHVSLRRVGRFGVAGHRTYNPIDDRDKDIMVRHDISLEQHHDSIRVRKEEGSSSFDKLIWLDAVCLVYNNFSVILLAQGIGNGRT